ncbi:organomercurial lyase [Dactylosporangium sp. NPDC048998]|uniref:organomercurial lyase n=1 Tax=Dactylosporangium sp. NPDC048998 TaxID=3363976 RepID=UPI00371D7553
MDTCCSTINFFVDPASARAWTRAHAGLTATVLDQDRALRLGRDIFGPLLHDPTQFGRHR